ncbi:3-oxoacyl-[acyl-carrier-protein] synthase III C-terminal domain-containing protein [Actinoplanes sp. NPDC051475]|uniref:3-oxoacyl-[acyl-carrier-protein] synthase III C-terminal domain-containing protein n=1 Tax=Actinoplanes sp. NPDC051475 TaxID=3157225 RepID=UPI003450ECEB
MTALLEVAAYLPPDEIPIGALQPRLGFGDAELRVYHRVYGLSSVRYDVGALPADLLLSAVGQLECFDRVRDRIRYIVQARTIPEVAPYPLSPVEEVRRKLGLEHALPFAVTEQACAVGIFAVDLCGRLLAQDRDPGGLALVLTGEKAFTRAALQVPGASMNGECAAAILVAPTGDRDVLCGYASQTYGEFFEFQARDKATVAEFQRIYTDALAEVLVAAADQAELSLRDVSVILPHNVNRISWIRVAKELRLPLERFFLDNVASTGHSFCADPFVNFASARDAGLIRPGEHYLMATVGLGATFSAMAFRH